MISDSSDSTISKTRNPICPAATADGAIMIDDIRLQQRKIIAQEQLAFGIK